MQGGKRLGKPSCPGALILVGNRHLREKRGFTLYLPEVDETDYTLNTVRWTVRSSGA